ncbi:MAG: hypothetical protein PHU27_10215 [Salinivirgaceae bacterium]|nr:hypothetical protein [Salinivirgaceae bacterium]MDD4748125.1 hypothetical protein [Salinivirgaceae bacterium]MDY0279964.1 hypothetical protein [Salinivirgaceae bacterium]
MRNRLNFSILILFLFAIATLFTNCKTREKSQNTNNTRVENFDQFYNRFHSDSLFQISRIKIPLKGAIIDGEGTRVWTKSNWHLMKVKIYDLDTAVYKVEYKKHEHTFTEKFWIEDSGFSSEYRFELLKRKWFLVYALESNL